MTYHRKHCVQLYWFKYQMGLHFSVGSSYKKFKKLSNSVQCFWRSFTSLDFTKVKNCHSDKSEPFCIPQSHDGWVSKTRLRIIFHSVVSEPFQDDKWNGAGTYNRWLLDQRLKCCDLTPTCNAMCLLCILMLFIYQGVKAKLQRLRH